MFTIFAGYFEDLIQIEESKKAGEMFYLSYKYSEREKLNLYETDLKDTRIYHNWRINKKQKSFIMSTGTSFNYSLDKYRLYYYKNFPGRQDGWYLVGTDQSVFPVKNSIL